MKDDVSEKTGETSLGSKSRFGRWWPGRGRYTPWTLGTEKDNEERYLPWETTGGNTDFSNQINQFKQWQKQNLNELENCKWKIEKKEMFVCLTFTPNQKTKNIKYCQIHTFSAFLSEMSCFSRTAMLSFRFFTMSAGDLWDFPNGNGMAAATDAFAALCLLHLGTRHKVWVRKSGISRRCTF